MQTSHVAASPAPGTAAQTATSPGAVDAPVGFGSSRQAILRVVAAQVLGALTQGTDGLRGLRSHPGREHGEHGSAGAVAQALKSAAAQGTDPQTLLGKVQDGLDAAHAALAERGFDPAQIAAVAAQFTQRVASLMDAPAADAAPTGDALAASVQISRRERGSLVLTTQDGDVLKIRFRSSERQQAELAAVTSGDAQAASVQLSSRERSRTRVEVEGALDADELKAIEDFVGKVDALANEFFEGDTEAAFAAAAALDYDASEIAGFSLKLSMSEKVQASTMQRTTAFGPGNAPALPPARTTPVDARAAAGQPAVPAAGGASANTSSGSSDPLRSVEHLMRRVLDTADAPLSVSGFKLAWSAKVRLAAEVVAVAAPAATKQPGAALLSKVLDSAAAQGGADAPQMKLAEAA